MAKDKKGKALYFCENCGSEVGANARFCPKCGRFFSSVRCPKCGYTGATTAFKNGCPKCHYAMNGSFVNSSKSNINLKNKKHFLFPKRYSNTAINNISEDGEAPAWLYFASIALLLFFVALIFYKCTH